MPTQYVIDPELRLVRSRAWGTLSDSESRAHYEHIAADPLFSSSFRQVCDLRAVERIEAATSALRGLAQLSVFEPGTRRAFVAYEDEHFGLARMLQAFCAAEGTELGVFRTLEAAAEWLDVPPAVLQAPFPE